MRNKDKMSKYRVSIIIPMYNASKTIIENLKSLEKQTYKNFEVIIVDDGSTDDSISKIKNFRDKSKLTIPIAKQKNMGPASARNKGAKHANGDILLFTDADCILPNNWVKEMIDPIDEQNNIIGAHCGYEIKNKKSLIARYIDYETKKRHSNIRGKITDSVGTYSFSIKKETFKEMDGFDTSYKTASGEDFDFSYKLSNNNYKIYFTGKTFAYHFHPESFLKYLKQQFYRGFWRVPVYFENKSKALAGDSYSGLEPQLQFFLVGFFLLSFVGLFYLSYIPLVFIFTLYLSNIPYGLFSYKFERKMLFLAPLFASIRSISGFFGAIIGVISYVGDKQ